MPSFDQIYAQHFAFVWRVLRTFGVAEAALEDAAQDVFVVVHRRLPEFEGRSAITTWLFAIARRVAGSHRRRVTREDRVAARRRQILGAVLEVLGRGRAVGRHQRRGTKCRSWSDDERQDCGTDKDFPTDQGGAF